MLNKESHTITRAGLLEKSRAVMDEFDTYNEPERFAADFAFEQFGGEREVVEAIRIIDELNTDVYSRTGMTDSPFNVTTNGMYYAISFEDHRLWDTENDDREYDSVTGEMGNLKGHIIKKFNAWARQVSGFRFGK